MDNVLWQKVFQIAKNLGGPKDLVLVDFLVGKNNSTDRAENIQQRWDARRQKRKIAHGVSSLGVSKGTKKI